MPISRSKIAALSTAVSSIAPTTALCSGARAGVKVLHAAVNRRLGRAADDACGEEMAPC